MLSTATEVWGIGVVLFEATTGQTPFSRDEQGRYRQNEEQARPVQALRRVPKPFAAAVNACLEPESGGRPTVAQLAETLGALV